MCGAEPTHQARAETKLAWAMPCKEEEDNSQGSFAGLTANVPEAVDLSESIKIVNLKSSITR